MTDYQHLLDAVEKYYGAGSDQWEEIAKYGISSENAESILSQVPGVSIVKNASGNIRSYNFQASENVASSAVNSNVPAVIKSFEVPANTGVETITTPAGEIVEHMTFKSGMAQAGNFVFGEVVPAVAAAGVGITLGKTIDKLLYSANPDFWDENSMSTLNPDTWGNIIGTDSSGARVLNTILGTTPDNKTQAYIDENALAYMALYLQNRGAFAEQTIEYYEPDETYQDKFYNYNQIKNLKLTSLPKKCVFPRTYINNPVTENRKLNITSGNPLIILGRHKSTNDALNLYIVSENEFAGTLYYNDNYTHNNLDPKNVYPPYEKNTGYTFTKSFITNYQLATQAGFSSIIITATDEAQILNDLLAFTIYSKKKLSGGIDGIGTQDNAKTPDLSSATTPDEVLAKLKEQYPELFEKSVSQNVVQPDGTTKTYTYVPIAMPELDTYGNPVSSASTQSAPQVDTATATEPLIDLITKIIQRDPPTNPPSTGSGDSPTVIMPTGSASSLYAIYNPTLAQINSFGAWLWSDNFVDQIKKLFNDPMQAIIGLHKVYATPATGGEQNIKVGYLDSGVPSKVVSDQYTTIDCGTITLSEYFHNVFDYSPYTVINLYLPFIGIVSLDNADVMRSSIHIVYHVDVLSGACLAEVQVTRDGAGGTLYQYTGNASVTLPISSGSYMGIVASIASIAGGIAGTIASGGAALPMITSAAGSALSARAKVEHSGGFSGNAGAMGGKIPYIIISRPQVELADSFQKYIGFPANYTTKLGDCSGYVKVLECHIENVNATNSELTEIDSLLKSGVII